MIKKHLPKGTMVYWIDPKHRDSQVFELHGYDGETVVLETDTSQCLTEKQESIFTEDFLDGWISNNPMLRDTLSWDNLTFEEKGNRYEMYILFNNNN